MRTKCKGPTCGRVIIMALDEERKWIPLDDRAPIYRIVADEGGQHRAIRLELGSVGVLHHVTCKDRDRFSKAAAPLTTPDRGGGPGVRPEYSVGWTGGREIRDPCTGEVTIDPGTPAYVSADRSHELAARLEAALEVAGVPPRDRAPARLRFFEWNGPPAGTAGSDQGRGAG